MMGNSIDWTATGSMLSGWATLIGAGAVIYAAHKGSDTFRQWRRQKSEERRIELAEQVLTLAYKLRRAIEGIRSPAMLPSESGEVHELLRETGVVNDRTPLEHLSAFSTAQAAMSRSNFHKPLWDALFDTMPSAKAVFGDEIETALNEFWTQRNRVITAANSYVRAATRPAARTEDAQEKQFKRQNDIEAILWSGGDENGVDVIADAIDNATKSLERKLLPIIRSDTPFGTSNLGS